MRTGEPWTYDEERYAEVTAMRRAEQAAMFAYGEDGRCLMQALQSELDDPRAEPCGRCAVCAGPRFDAPVDAGLAREAYAIVRSRPIVLTVRRQTPRTADQAGKKIAPELQLEEGRALARAGRRRLGRARPRRAAATAASTTSSCRRAPTCSAAGTRPPRRSGSPRCRRAARARSCPTSRQRLAGALGLPYATVLERVGDNPPQREMANSAQQVANVRGEFRVPGSPFRPARGCSSTTCATPAGRSRRSARSCG